MTCPKPKAELHWYRAVVILPAHETLCLVVMGDGRFEVCRFNDDKTAVAFYPQDWYGNWVEPLPEWWAALE